MEFRADMTLSLGASLFEGDALATLERLLHMEARAWASDIHIYREGDRLPRREIKAFATDVRKVALERGELYESLIARYGPGPSPRRFGTVELRGADDSIIIVVCLDEWRFQPSSGRWLWGNRINIQVCEAVVAGEDAVEFIRRVFARGCDELSPWYGHAEALEEWDAKNISHAGGGTMAVGLDASRYLPGLYWLNFFGEPYRNLIGADRLLTAPAHETKALEKGVLLQLASTPNAWNTPQYKACEHRVLMHLGKAYFFSPRDPPGESVAPDFGLKSLPRNPRFT